MSDLAEHDNEVEVESDADKMQSSHDNAGEEGRKDDGCGREVAAEEARPSIVDSGLQIVILVGVERDKDVEWDQAGVHEQREEVVAATAIRRATLCRAQQVVDGVHGDDRVPSRLKINQSVFQDL